MNNDLLRMYYFKERVEAKRRLIRTKIRIKAKHAAGLLGKMPIKSGCHMVSPHGVVYSFE